MFFPASTDSPTPTCGQLSNSQDGTHTLLHMNGTNALKHELRQAYPEYEFSVTKYKDSRLKSDPEYTICPKGAVFTDDSIAWAEKYGDVSAGFKNSSPQCLRMRESRWYGAISKVHALVEPVNELTTAEKKPSSARKSPALAYYERVQQLIQEKGTDRAQYTEDDMKVLRGYEGMGGLHKEGVTGTGILSQFYTPAKIASKMWGLALKYGFQHGQHVLEPSCGIGRFFPYTDPATITAYEIDEVAATIAKLLHPEVSVHNQSFEQVFYEGERHSPNRFSLPKFDLVIGNPPYESYKSYWAGKGEKAATGVHTFDQYFLFRGIDLLNPGGLLVMIIPSTFLRNSHLYNRTKLVIAERAELLDAYRLPNDAFPNTYVGTDILIFKKR